MADVITRFKLETTQFDSKLRDAAKGLKDVIHQASLGGKDFTNFSQKSIDAARALGTIESGANNTKDKLKDMVGSFNDAAKAYNNLSKAQQQSDFGKAMAQSLDQLNQRIKQTKDELYSLNSTTDSMKGSGGLFGGDKFSGMLQVFGGNVMTKLAGVGVNFVSEMGDMVKQGIELARAGEGVRIAFERLGRGDLLDGLREATHGTVTDLELMKAAVKFNDFKLPVEELGTMLAFAQQKAKDTGQSVDYMVDSIVTGLGRKSLMILDNLGLSAAEIKERMKETGDMTKAVGEIIREQMSKAGDYVETAADRATQANVELTNAMTRLGETFQPVTDMGTSMWTSLKVGALDLLNNVVTPLINKFTELGRIRQQYADQGGDERVNRMLGRLRGIGTDTYRQGTYKAQLANFDTKIGSYQQYLADYKKWQGDKTAVGAYDRMQAFQKQTGLSMYSDVKEQLAVFQKMRAEYVQGAKAILAGNPAPSPADTTPTPTVTTPTPKGGNQLTEEEIIAKIEKGLLAGLERQVIGTKAIEPTGPSSAFTMFAGAQHQQTGKDPMIAAMVALNKSQGITASGTASKWKLGKNGQLVEDKDKQDHTSKEMLQGVETMVGSLQSIASGIQTLGIELPKELTSIFGVLQTITGIVGAIQSMQTVGTFLGIFAKGGKVPHAANGYYIPGNRYSGDTTPILANAGELVLNESSQNNLALGIKNAEALVQTIERYQDSVMRGSQAAGPATNIKGGNDAGGGSPYLTGEVIYLGLSAYLESSGRGEIVTSRKRG